MRLDNVWGVGGGLRPVKYLIKQIVLLLKEYLCSGDIGEASRCLRELEVPHFHHELVYEVNQYNMQFFREINFTKNFVKINFTENLFHYRFCFQAVVMVIESMHEKTEEAMCKLLQALFRSFIISIDQMKNVS